MTNVITLFSGYDSQCLALRRLGIDFELVAWSEIDRNAIAAHNVLFPEYADRNLGDVAKVDWTAIDKPIDLLTYSSPCQDFSQAGLQRGGEAGSGTRSSLLWECERAISALRPRFAVLENVAALVSEKFLPLFGKWCKTLQGLGYTNYWQLMNAKDYGVPQNRLRVFLVSIRDEEDRPYYFPKPFKLERRLKDVLEQDVTERYYLSDEKVRGLLDSASKDSGGDGCQQVGQLDGTYESAGRVYSPDGASPTINTCQGGGREPKIVVETEASTARICSRDKDNPTGIRTKNNGNFAQRIEVGSSDTSNTITSVAKDSMVVEQSPRQASIRASVLDNGNIRCYQDDERKSGVSEMQFTNPDNESPTVTTQGQVKVIEQQVLGWTRDQQGNITERHPVSVANCVTAGKRDNTQNYVTECPAIIDDTYKGRDPREYSEVAPTLRADREGFKAVEQMGIMEKETIIRVRRLTERELYRLMDVDDADIDKLLASNIAKTQHAKLAGNSIVVGVLYHLFNRLLVKTAPEHGEQLQLF